ncbi:hypothetical protein C8Q70DRAFT_935556 [Cubamyces menziesii]|nr:hypothetical protein C8Q70DRAFT_935556 [Cubamyces menziesii]
MATIRTYTFWILLLHVLAVVTTSSARVPEGGLARSVQQQHLDDTPEYEMLITPDEERRIVELLGHEYLNVGLIATKVTGPPRHCSVCGKETEFIDWVFTALARGIHSPEFIVESLKLGNSPKKLGHDVYCSRCGHLTHFRDATGEEGGASYISLATPYDRASRTFGNNVYKREAANAEDTSKEDGADTVPPVWRPLWTRKRDDESEGTDIYPGQSDWRKRDEGTDIYPGQSGWRREEDTTPPAWRPLWTRKRDEEGTDIYPGQSDWRREEDLTPPVWRPLWTRKRDEEGTGIYPGQSDWRREEDITPPAWRPLWTRKRDEATDIYPRQSNWRHEEDLTPPVWRPLWTKKREEDITPPAWRPLWTRKRDEEDTDIYPGQSDWRRENNPTLPEEGLLPPVWRPLWTKKREQTSKEA